MTNREKALQIANDAIERVESGNIMPDTNEAMAYALVLMLADIGERLEEIEKSIGAIWADGIGCG